MFTPQVKVTFSPPTPIRSWPNSKILDFPVIEKEERLQSSPSAAVEDKLTALQKEIDNYKDIFDSALLVISNEFIKPLTSIKGYMGLLERNFREMGGMAEKEMRLKKKERKK